VAHNQSEEQFWDDKHHSYAAKKFVRKPNWLATTLSDNLEAPAKILDLGCGQGQDSLYFRSLGHEVTALDFSKFALAQFADAARAAGVPQVRHDLGRVPYPFPAEAFDIVYAHLTLHYFDQATTRQIFAEVARLLKPHGQLWALFNSDHDPEASDPAFATIEERYLELAPGSKKRYFSAAELPDLLGERFQVNVARYGHGTNKNKNDAYVELVANKEVD